MKEFYTKTQYRTSDETEEGLRKSLEGLFLKAVIFILKKLGFKVNDWNTKYIIITKKVD